MFTAIWGHILGNALYKALGIYTLFLVIGIMMTAFKMTPWDGVTPEEKKFVILTFIPVLFYVFVSLFR